MGKHLQREHSNPQFEGNHPGCMWGILHILDYHYWHNVKKLLPRRRNSRGRHARCSESRKLSLNSHDPGAVEAVMNDEADYFFVDQSTKTSPTNKSSGKARIKALIAKEMSKEENHKRQVLGTPAQSRFQRTDSIHHLEPSDHRLPEIKTDWRHPIIFLHSIPNTSATKLQDPSLLKAPEKLVPCNNKCDIYGTMNAVGYLGQNQVAEKHKLHPEHIDKERETSLNQKLKDANQLDRDASHPQFEDYVDDVLEIFKVNKELFLKMLQDPDVGNANRFHILPKKVRLNKSGSFPVADVTRGRNFRPTKLEHKQNEVWSFPKGEKFLAGTQASRLVVSMSSKDLSAKSMPLMDDDSAGSVLKQEKSFSSLDLPSGFNDQESNQASMYCFKDSKQKINHAIKENKEESNHTPLDAFLHRFPHGCRISTDGKEIAKRWKESTQGADGSDSPKIVYEIDGSVYDLGKGSRIHRVRRASSLNESLDRYSQLLEFSFRNEAKLHLSKSLKLTKEGEVSSAGHGPNSFRRILSVTDLESYFPLQNEGSRDAFCSGMPVRTVVDSSINVESEGHDEPEPVGLPINIEKCAPADSVVGTESMLERSDSSPIIDHESGLTVGINNEGTVIMGELSEDMAVPMEDNCSDPEQEIGFTKNASNELAQPSPVSVLETCFQDDITCPPKSQISEGLELKPRCINFDDLNPSVNLQNMSSTDAVSGSCSIVDFENVKNASQGFDNHFLHIELDKKNGADFSYVREILEQSGVIGSEYIGTCPTVDQPLNPAVIEEAEACLPNEPESSGEEVDVSCDHHLLFDLVNEALLEINERSDTYWPRALSSSCRIHPIPMGYRVLEEVWASISCYLSSRQELEQSFDHVVAQDLAKGDDWMNLQLETECVALELEDIIFDELLGEIICS